MIEKIENNILNDYYGGLLNGHQAEIMHLYYDCDMSLSEIAEEISITRQGVREVIVRCNKKLNNYEKKLGLVKKVKGILNKLKIIIDSENFDNSSREKLSKLLEEIREI